VCWLNVAPYTHSCLLYKFTSLATADIAANCIDIVLEHCGQLFVHSMYRIHIYAAWLTGCVMTQLVMCRAAVRRPRVRISARHPIGDPLPELAAMKILEQNSANVINECV